jgi:hypothetical protein
MGIYINIGNLRAAERAKAASIDDSAVCMEFFFGTERFRIY